MEDLTEEIPRFEPWTKYPSLTQDRLIIVANLIRDVRHEAVLAHEPGRGDTNWGLGTRVYERTCFKLTSVAPEYSEWLFILPETKGLQFSFAIGSVPFRFYRGKPDEPQTDTTYAVLESCTTFRCVLKSKGFDRSITS